MIKEPKTRKEKIQFLKDSARYVRTTVAIYGEYDSEKGRYMNYYLSRNGKISARYQRGGKSKDRMEVEDFAKKFGEEGLNFAIKQIKVKINIHEISS